MLISLHLAFGQAPWLTDDEAREVAATAVRSVYPQPCYSTYRDERLEKIVLAVRVDRLQGRRLNQTVYVYNVASDSCDYVTDEGGKPDVTTQVTMDCCDYGIVAVDRGTRKSYWFAGAESDKVFQEFVRDEQLRPDSEPILFAALYRDLVLSGQDELTSIGQLRDLVQRNFRSAYSPYERDGKWQSKFNPWWRRFLSHDSQLKLETTYDSSSNGTIVRGYAFDGFKLTTPRSDPPPKGIPSIVQWAFLIRADGTVEGLPSTVIYSRP